MHAGKYSVNLWRRLIFFKFTFLKNVKQFRSNQVRRFVGPDLYPTCLQRLSAEDSSRPRVNIPNTPWPMNSLWINQQVSCADYFCKQFGPRSGPTKWWDSSGSKLFATLMVFLKEYFENFDFEKYQQTTNQAWKITEWAKAKSWGAKHNCRKRHVLWFFFRVFRKNKVGVSYEATSRILFPREVATFENVAWCNF